MLTTLSVIKADIGGYVGHSESHPNVIAEREECVAKAKRDGLLVDYHVTKCGDDLQLTMTHQQGISREKIHKLAWDTFPNMHAGLSLEARKAAYRQQTNLEARPIIGRIVDSCFASPSTRLLSLLIERFPRWIPKALFLDLDGTASKEGWVYQKGVDELLDVCREIGIYLVPSTGRSIEDIGFWSSLPEVKMVVAHNGGLIRRRDQVLTISDDMSAIYHHLHRKHSDWHIWPSVVPVGTGRLTVELCADGQIPEDELRAAVQRIGGPNTYVLRSIEKYHIGRFHKGQALEYVCDVLRIRPWDSIAVGDSPLDIPMFERAGVSIAINGCSSDVQREAHFVTRRPASEALLEVALFLKLIAMRRPQKLCTGTNGSSIRNN